MYAFGCQETRHVERHISELIFDPQSVEDVEGTEHVVTSQGVQTGQTNRLDRQGRQEYNIYI
jgi:hypothetical protein